MMCTYIRRLTEVYLMRSSREALEGVEVVGEVGFHLLVRLRQPRKARRVCVRRYISSASHFQIPFIMQKALSATILRVRGRLTAITSTAKISRLSFAHRPSIYQHLENRACRNCKTRRTTLLPLSRKRGKGSVPATSNNTCKGERSPRPATRRSARPRDGHATPSARTSTARKPPMESPVRAVQTPRPRESRRAPP